jgi:hypothetical protein
LKEFSKETIEIDGKEYTLFLNRKGIVAWEKFCESENKKIAELREKYASLIDKEETPTEISDETNPFDGLEAFDELDEQQEVITKSFKRLYWIMLYTEHKLPLSEVETLYDKASEEYGENNLIALAQQMIDDASIDKVTKDKELKNLTALRPTK